MVGLGAAACRLPARKIPDALAARALAPEDGGAIPAVALTALARAEDRLRALRAGFQAHTAKPVETAELIYVAAGLTGRMARPRRAGIGASR